MGCALPRTGTSLCTAHRPRHANHRLPSFHKSCFRSQNPPQSHSKYEETQKVTSPPFQTSTDGSDQYGYYHANRYPVRIEVLWSNGISENRQPINRNRFNQYRYGAELWDRGRITTGSLQERHFADQRWYSRIRTGEPTGRTGC